MSKTILAAVLLAATATTVLAAPSPVDTGSLSGKAQSDFFANSTGGQTAYPLAKPADQSLSGKAMRDLPGNMGRGTTQMPTAQIDDNSLSGKASRDLVGRN